jgi:hypothetical protein
MKKIYSFAVVAFIATPLASAQNDQDPKDLIAKALKGSTTVSTEQAADSWITASIEKADLPVAQMQLLMNVLHCSYMTSAVGFQTSKTERQLAKMLIIIRSPITKDTDFATMTDDFKKQVDYYRSLKSQLITQKAILDACMSYVQTKKELVPFGKAFDAFLLVLTQEVVAQIKKNVPALEKAIHDAGALLDDVANNTKQLAEYYTLLAQGKFPMEVPENEKDITRINLAAEIAHAVEHNNTATSQSMDPIMEQEDSLTEISKKVSAIFYHKLYQACLKKKIKPVVMFTTKGFIEEAQQKELLPSVLK